ncbi:DUF4124 domain-containing protein [Pseudomonas kuykendallii]|uniref:DUF4124 domain-containing protein n=1 Tax=Pseudomonas kuykendallii TaxID=1007099 RepID=A0A2W5FAZ6_9PSED|nr:DUF4124 domain-containing protein [Pseudomonas kuykendallii]PZP26779.1 MAG: DUF4124 domain-containing protein [Pseudomonas kuykendallii]
MHGSLYAGLFALALGLPHAATAASVFRCVDAAGKVTFSQRGCPIDQQQALQQAENPTPGNGKPVPMATPKKNAGVKSGKKQAKPRELVVTGGQDDGCGNLLDASQRRQATIRREVRDGMSRQDIESAFGRPDKISTQNGQVRYTYEAEGNGRSRQVTFDEAGCVKSKAKKKR